MAVGESITAVPARITYSLIADTGPGFVEFDPNKKGTNPCKNKSNFVTVIRTGEATWEIVADPNTIACVLLPGGSGFGGTYRMPFQFTVQKK